LALQDLETMSRNDSGIETVISVLKQRFGERLKTSQSFLEQHAHTMTYIPSQLPDAVVFAESTEDLQQVVRVCAEYKVPIIPFGTGTSLEGGVNAPAGGISIDLNAMNKVLQVNAEDLDCVIQPGVTREALNDYLRDTGLFFPIDPGANASLGGMAATRASGTNAVRYGTMRENVISMKVVMPNGKVVKTAARTRKSSAGYDLTKLMIGSEGTLGIITELTVRLHGVPERISAGICQFETVEGACNATIMAMQMGLPMARIELLDALQVEMINKYSGLDYKSMPTLFLEFHGTEDGVNEQVEVFTNIAEDLGGGVMRAIAMEGTCTGEHGIGQGKRRFLRIEHGAGADIMASIKHAIDPDNIMNPGKVVGYNE